MRKWAAAIAASGLLLAGCGGSGEDEARQAYLENFWEGFSEHEDQCLQYRDDPDGLTQWLAAAHESGDWEGKPELEYRHWEEFLADQCN